MLLREFFDALEGDSSAKSTSTSPTTATKQNTSAKANLMVAETNNVTAKKVTSKIKR
jgi:hypothetical protein